MRGVAGPAARLVLGALALGLAVQYLVVSQRAGINVVLAVAAALALARSARPRGATLRPRDAWIPGGALALAAGAAARDDPALVAFDVLAALALTLATVPALHGVPVASLTLRALAGEGLALAGRCAGRAPRVLREAGPALAALVPARSSRVLGYGAGVALAVPLLVVFAGLFSSADAVFQRSLAAVLDLAWLRGLFAQLPARVVLAAAVAWVALGALAPRQARPAPPQVRRPLPRDAAVGALAAIDLLFASFVAFQLAYLFGGRDTLEAAGISYSAYARTGFFELVAVAAMVASLLFALDLALRARGRAYVAAALALVALTGVVLASSMRRLSLYQEAYGWTELRLYAIAGIAFLALALAVLAAAVARDAMARAAQPIVLAALSVALAVNAVGPSAVIALQNVDRFLAPASLPEDAYRGLDVGYLETLGDGAVPVVAERLPLLPDTVRSWVREMLLRERARRPAEDDWRGWNLDRVRAGEALRALATQ